MAAATASSLALTLRSARCALARRRAPIRAPARRASSVAAGTGNPAGASDDAFVVTYCHNWDGGGQEFNAAKEAILSVFADAEVVPNRIDSYPITVTVTQASETIWTGRQQGLFGKNGRPAQREIIAALEALR